MKLTMKILTDKRADILVAIVDKPSMQIADIAERVHRDEASVRADIDVLINAGFLFRLPSGAIGYHRIRP